MRKKLKEDQRGFTLIELIVTVMIMSIVMVAAAGFIITAANSYRVANIEVQLQTEAQMAMNQFNDILIGAKSYTFKDENNGVLTVTTIERLEDSVLSTKQYTFKVVDGSLMFRTDTSTKDALLANYCKSFKIDPESFSDGEKGKKLITVTIEFELAGRVYTTTNCISLRNQ